MIRRGSRHPRCANGPAPHEALSDQVLPAAAAARSWRATAHPSFAHQACAWPGPTHAPGTAVWPRRPAAEEALTADQATAAQSELHTPSLAADADEEGEHLSL